MLFLATRSLDPTGKGRARWTRRWKPALNALAITFEGRITPSSKPTMIQIQIHRSSDTPAGCKIEVSNWLIMKEHPDRWLTKPSAAAPR